MKPSALIHFLFLLLSSYCSVAQTLDKAAIKAIDVQLAPLPFTKLNVNDLNAIRTSVIANLSQWQFPLHAANGNTYSHTLTIEVSSEKYDQTPVGFSFTSGDSDPRAPGFQKARVIPIHCRLTDNNHPQQQEDLAMTFPAPSLSISQQQLQATLTDNISSVCFDLLDNLKFLPTEAVGQPATKPTWLPSIQVETVPVAQPKHQAIEEKPKQTAAKVLPSPSATPITPTQPDISTKTKAIAKPEETTQQIIIHNQGTPVIIKLGHDRQ